MWTKNLSWKNKTSEKNLPKIQTKDIDVFLPGSCPPIDPNTEGPPILLKLIDYLKSNALELNQVFIQKVQEKDLVLIKKKIKLDDHHVDLKSYIKDSRVVGELIKQYLLALPEPLLTFERYDSFIIYSQLLNKDDQITHIKGLISTLPNANKITCTKLFSLLHMICNNSSNNHKVSAELAQIMAPLILYPKKKTLNFRTNDETQAIKCIKFTIDESKNLYPSISFSSSMELNPNKEEFSHNIVPLSPTSLRIATALTPSSLNKGSNFIRSHRGTKSVDFKLNDHSMFRQKKDENMKLMGRVENFVSLAEKQIKEFRAKALENDLSFLTVLEKAHNTLFQTASSLLFVNSKDRIKQIVESNKLRPPHDDKFYNERRDDKMFNVAIIQIHNILDALYFFKWKTKNTFDKQDVLNMAKIVSELHKNISAKPQSQELSLTQPLPKLVDSSPHKRSLSLEVKENLDIRDLILQSNKLIDNKLYFIEKTIKNDNYQSSLENLSKLILDMVTSFQKFYSENKIELPNDKVDRVLNFDIDINNDPSALSLDLEQIKKYATHLHQLVITSELKEEPALLFLKSIRNALFEYKDDLSVRNYNTEEENNNTNIDNNNSVEIHDTNSQEDTNSLENNELLLQDNSVPKKENENEKNR
eukprot:TRINITY_DN6694_c0_g1_i1.p1 TRINITY_DN6694_c0_g1~~TRINITY_DN6694_c0_g1_i1.p1  ORF type:complete len:645 (-),score=192.27 TRINITY_DN6694_c0_g1_i1:371-2305(-)